jgi:hypothetical protein
MQNSIFNCEVYTNGELRLKLDFNFGGDYSPETKKEVVGTIVQKFLKYMEMYNRYKKNKAVTSRDCIDFRFTMNGQHIGTSEISAKFGIDFRFRFNKTIEEKLEYFIADAIDFAQVDEITEAKHI